MASVVSAAVVSGELIIGLDDGSIIRAGYVQGPQGLKGDQGPLGATGPAGEDGNTIHTVEGTPDGSLGKDGDYAINRIDWRIHGPKAGGRWPQGVDMLAKGVKKPLGEKGSSGFGVTGGGGGPAGTISERPPILDDGSNTPPVVYPGVGILPGTQLKDGDMWVDANGALYFYYNAQWNKVTVYADQVLPADDAPFAIATPNGEIFIHQKEYNEWLYTRTDRRPIISTSAPTIHPDFPAYPLRAGDYWIDDNHRLYFWDGAAWLPIEGNAGRTPIFAPNEPTEHPDYVAPDNALEVGDIWYDTDENFKQYIWDGTDWIALSTGRSEAFTRFYEAVDPTIYNSGNDNTCALIGGATLNLLTNVKLSGNDGQGKVRYLYKVNEDILIEDERNGAYAVLRVTAINAAGDYDVELEHYNGVGNVDIGHSYAFGSAADRGAIPDVSEDTHQPGTLDDRYVNEKGGDSMEGPLDINGGRNADPVTGVQSSIKVLNVDSGENSSLQLKFDGASKVYVGNEATSFQHHIKINQDGKQIYAGDDTDKKGLSFHSDGVEYHGDYTEDKHVATKKDVEEAIYHDRTDPDTNKYVDRSGDVMDGDLVLEESRLVFRNPVGDQTLIRGNREVGKFPVLLDLVNNGSNATLGGYDIKIGGSTSYNQLRFVGQDTYLTINGGGGSNTPVKFHKDVDCGNIRFTKLGPAIDDKDAVNYGQIKQELQEFRDELIQNLSFGSWIYNGNLGIQPPAGRCYFRNEAGQTSALTPSSVVQMVFNEEDALGANGAFDRIDTGEIISLTDGNVTIKYKVNSAASTSGPQNEVRSFEVVYLSQTGAWTFVDGGVWTFTLTEFADISVDQLDDTYLRLDCANDPLETELEIKTPSFGEAQLTLNGKRDNDSNSTASIAFKNQYNTDENYVGYLSYRTKGDDTAETFFRFNQDVDFSSKGLKKIDYAQFINDGVIKHNDNDRIKFQNRGTANDGDGLVVFERPGSNGRRGITIRGLHPDDDQETDILWTYTNATDGDAVNYNGKMSMPDNLVNKQYVDDAVASGGSGLPAGGAKGQVLKKDHATGNTQWQGAIDINPDGNNRAKGEMWFNQNDGTLYLKVS